MKVGIDGILLGAWVEVGQPLRVLDVGAGTGLLALMLAQRTKTTIIDAIEIDKDAYKEASFNISQSKWKNRINVIHSSLQDFAVNCSDKYDLIISNPPFFDNALINRSESRAKARDRNYLSPEVLFGLARRMLNQNGSLAIVYPFQDLEKTKAIIEKEKLIIQRLLLVGPDEAKTKHRFLVEVGFNQVSCVEEELYLRNVSDQSYSRKYRELTSDFYLHLK